MACLCGARGPRRLHMPDESGEWPRRHGNELVELATSGASTRRSIRSRSAMHAGAGVGGQASCRAGCQPGAESMASRWVAPTMRLCRDRGGREKGCGAGPVPARTPGCTIPAEIAGADVERQPVAERQRRQYADVGLVPLAPPRRRSRSGADDRSREVRVRDRLSVGLRRAGHRSRSRRGSGHVRGLMTHPLPMPDHRDRDAWRRHPNPTPRTSSRTSRCGPCHDCQLMPPWGPAWVEVPRVAPVEGSPALADGERRNAHDQAALASRTAATNGRRTWICVPSTSSMPSPKSITLGVTSLDTSRSGPASPERDVAAEGEEDSECRARTELETAGVGDERVTGRWRDGRSILRDRRGASARSAGSMIALLAMNALIACLPGCHTNAVAASAGGIGSVGGSSPVTWAAATAGRGATTSAVA